VKYLMLNLAIITLVFGTFCSNFTATLHTLSSLVTRKLPVVAAPPGDVSALRSDVQTDQPPSVAVHDLCRTEGTRAEPGSPSEGVLPQNDWNAAFKEWHQRVQRLEMCAQPATNEP
jgi:hypothetical protein